MSIFNKVSDAATTAFKSAQSSVEKITNTFLGGGDDSDVKDKSEIVPVTIANSNEGQIVGEPQSYHWEADDRRVRLKPYGIDSRTVLGSFSNENILRPLHTTNGVVFPFTPTIMYNINAQWRKYELTHTNYQPETYERTDISDITITGKFSAQTPNEAEYKLATIHFFRTITKMHYGVLDKDRGSPPPVLKLSAYGGMFNDIPVVVKSFTHDITNDVDYVPVKAAGTLFDIPALSNITITLGIQPDIIKQRDEFDLESFRDGSLLRKKGYM